jgi:hypothetical protein
VAPFTVTPNPGSITRIVRQNEATRKTGVIARMAASPCRDARCITASPIRPNMR